MNEQLTPGMQRRVQELQRYLCAMETGDVNTLCTVLSEAEHDHELERMILEVNAFYQDEDSTTASPADVALAQQLLLNALSTIRTEEISVQSLNEQVVSPSTRKATTQVLPAKKLTPQKWYRTRRNRIVAAVAAVLLVLML